VYLIIFRSLAASSVLVLAAILFRADADEPAGKEIVLKSGLVVPPVGRYGRAPFPVDPIVARLVAGTWTAPKEGDAVQSAAGKARKWTPITAGKDGAFSSQALGGGYAYFAVPSDSERVMILAASGHMLVYVNGEPRVGDIYQTGYVRLPVLLHKGTNHLLFHVARGNLRARLIAPAAAAQLNADDALLPDLVDEQFNEVEGALPVINSRETPAKGLVLKVECAGAKIAGRTIVPVIPPLGTRRVGFRLVGKPEGIKELKPGIKELEATITLLDRDDKEADALDTIKVKLRVQQPEQTRKVTFRSDIDGSVQYYGLIPAKPAADAPKRGLVLTLHGAGVEGIGQANCFRPKTWTHVAAPTNRRPFGFDWEDWGRLDAMEVLDHAEKVLDTDPRRTYVTGHSMGGHGTWHLGVTFPGRFAAIGPSAGWISFWSYAGALKSENPSALHELVLRCANPSDTLALSRNYASEGVYILHGDKDDNVPVGQARTMRKHLAEFHSDFAYYERPGAGHWWGDPCVDWAPMFEYFHQHTLPTPADVRRVEFITSSPGVSASMHWAHIEGQRHPGKFSNVKLRLEKEPPRLTGTTTNVSRLAIDVGHLKPTKTIAVELDERSLPELPWPTTGTRLNLAHDGKQWSAAAPLSVGDKRPERYGPFRDAFRHRMVFVYGTKGSPAENAWALAKARLDAETFWYRASGSIDVIADTDFDPAPAPDRSVILYGNAQTNAAWDTLLGDSPVQVTAGRVTIGDRTIEGDNLACLFLRPRQKSAIACVAAISGTGLAGMRLTDRLPIFVSGIGYPDCLVFGTESLSDGMGGIRAAGFFGQDWGVKTGEFAWRQ
jgi:predicted esterase